MASPTRAPSAPEILSADELAERFYRAPDLKTRLAELQERLDREERRRREFYEWLDEDKKAEFIDGEVVVHSPVVKRHLDATLAIAQLLNVFTGVRALGYVATEKFLVRLRRNDFEPDVVSYAAETADDFHDDQLFFPAPDLAVEVLSPGTDGNDRKTKYADYAANGVREYWIVDSRAQTIERYVLQANETYELVETVSEAKAPLKCGALPGFEVPLAAAFDRGANLDALRGMLTAGE